MSLRLQNVYPSTVILWFKRQMDLELMLSSAIFFRTANWDKWTKFFTDLLVLVLAYTVPILTAISFTFFQRPERNIFTYISLYISHVLIEKMFRFQLRHHTCLITSSYNYILQLHPRVSLIKLTNITSLHFARDH